MFSINRIASGLGFRATGFELRVLELKVSKLGYGA